MCACVCVCGHTHAYVHLPGSLSEQTGPPKGNRPPNSDLSGPQASGLWSQVTHILHTLLLMCTPSDTCTYFQPGWMFSQWAQSLPPIGAHVHMRAHRHLTLSPNPDSTAEL